MALRLPRPHSARWANDPFIRYGSLGTQFAATLLVFGGLGWWLDEKLGTSPWLLIVGVFAGFGGGLYSLIRHVPPVEGGHRKGDRTAASGSDDAQRE